MTNVGNEKEEILNSVLTVSEGEGLHGLPRLVCQSQKSSISTEIAHVGEMAMKVMKCLYNCPLSLGNSKDGRVQ
jgi:hypothetical protein